MPRHHSITPQVQAVRDVWMAKALMARAASVIGDELVDELQNADGGLEDGKLYLAALEHAAPNQDGGETTQANVDLPSHGHGPDPVRIGVTGAG